MVRVNRDFDMFEVDLKATLLQTAKIAVHPDWYPCIEQAFAAMDPDYLLGLEQSDQWLPERQNMLMAFSQPLSAVRYVLLGESPYPRKQSANGYAFWDAAVGAKISELKGHTDCVRSVSWSENGKQIATGSDDKSVFVWDAAKGELVSKLEGRCLGRASYVMSVAWSPSGMQVRLMDS